MRFHFPYAMTCFNPAGPPTLQRVPRTKQARSKQREQIITSTSEQLGTWNFIFKSQLDCNWSEQSEKGTVVARTEEHTMYQLLPHVDTGLPGFLLRRIARGSLFAGSTQSTLVRGLKDPFSPVFFKSNPLFWNQRLLKMFTKSSQLSSGTSKTPLLIYTVVSLYNVSASSWRLKPPATNAQRETFKALYLVYVKSLLNFKEEPVVIMHKRASTSFQ